MDLAASRSNHPNWYTANRALFDMQWVKRQIGLCIAMVVRIGAHALCRESLRPVNRHLFGTTICAPPR